MKILLTTLHSKYIHASLALPYLQAYCQDLADFRICEFTVNEPKESVLAKIVEFDVDVVCFSVYIWNRLETLNLVRCLKLIRPDLKIVLGGPEVSFETQDFFVQHPVDALIRGEGERPLRNLLLGWLQGKVLRGMAGVQNSADLTPPAMDRLENLDEIPSPFAAGLVDLKRGLVYYESSRGCPYSCSFCMSALDETVRSFSMARIKSDLEILIGNRVPLIKFVDRTFNYDRKRTLEILKFLVAAKGESRYHLEIGAHLLDGEILDFLDSAPEDLFQFEIGVQSTLPETLERVSRRATFSALKENVERLIAAGRVHQHLDLIAGLPGENLDSFYTSLDRVLEVHPDHLQIEPVKLLPGAPLRQQAAEWGIIFDPQPPYTILKSSHLSYVELEQLRGVGRLLDLHYNSGRYRNLLPWLFSLFGHPSRFFSDLTSYWQERGLFAISHSAKDLFLVMEAYLNERLSGAAHASAQDLLARDYALCERVASGTCPGFFNTNLSEDETERVRLSLKSEIEKLSRSGKVQYFAALFNNLPEISERGIILFIYYQKPSCGWTVEEILIRPGA